MPRRHYLVPMLLALAVATGGQSAIGATQLSKTGNPGPWSLRDTNDRPGAECVYDADVPGGMGNDIDILSAVRTPRVLARNRTAARDSQWVGGRVFFERSVNPGGSGGFVTASSAKLRKKLAFDNQATSWGDRSWLVDVEEDYQFRISVLLRWYKPGSKREVQGTRRILYQKYLQVGFGSENVEDDRCLPEGP